jgi:hypothetical protein
MKSLYTLIVTLAVIGAARAQDLVTVVPENQAFNVYSTNYVFSRFTNAAPSNVVLLATSPSLYHTIHFYPTGVCSYAVDKSLDNTNWVLGTTTAIAAGVVTESTVTGKEGYLRIRIQGTNVGGGINYLGGR